MARVGSERVSSQSRRHWYQFSLRQLLLLFVVVAILLGSCMAMRTFVRELSRAACYAHLDGTTLHLRCQGTVVLDAELLADLIEEQRATEVLTGISFSSASAPMPRDTLVLTLDAIYYMKYLRLRRLSIDCSLIDDGDFRKLGRLSSLEELDLQESYGIAPAEVKRLQKALPKCKIHHY